MIEEPRLDAYVEALRAAMPSERDEARIRRRLTGAGLAVTAALTSKAVSASTTGIGKLGLLSLLSMRFGSLPLLAQLCLVTAGTAAAASGPVWVVSLFRAKRIESRVAVGVRDPRKPIGAARVEFPKESRELAPESPRVASSPAATTTALVLPVEANVGEVAIAASSAQFQRIGPPDPPQRAADVQGLANDSHRVTSLAPAGNRESNDLPPSEQRMPTLAPAGDEDVAPPVRRAGLLPPSLPTGKNDAGNLRLETRLIDAALSAIRAGNLTLAQRLLDEHAGRFPNASLALERELAQQKLDEARRRAPP